MMQNRRANAHRDKTNAWNNIRSARPSSNSPSVVENNAGTKLGPLTCSLLHVAAWYWHFDVTSKLEQQKLCLVSYSKQTKPKQLEDTFEALIFQSATDTGSKTFQSKRNVCKIDFAVHEMINLERFCKQHVFCVLFMKEKASLLEAGNG